jgi:hypothetical protein
MNNKIINLQEWKQKKLDKEWDEFLLKLIDELMEMEIEDV